MKRCTGRIKLTIGLQVINQAAYHSRLQREAIIETWRHLHGYKMEGMYFVIGPHLHKANENKWSRRV